MNRCRLKDYTAVGGIDPYIIYTQKRINKYKS